MRVQPVFAALLRQVLMILFVAALGTAQSRAQTPLGTEQLDALTAPIALYPDTLLAQVLIASTYPAEVAQANQWAQQNSSLQGTQLNAALDQQTWDPSVKALIQVPTVLQQMSSRTDWTQQLGDAFLAQQADVMDSVQRLRQRAQDAGNLMTTEQQVVMKTGQTIVIEQASPQVIYVPSYEPSVVYGGWPYPAYPPYYWPTPPGYAFARGLAWGAGFAIGAAAWNNAFDWGGHNVNVNVNRNNFNNINTNNFNSNRLNNSNVNSQRWEHNSANRRGANYRDTATREKFGKTNTTAANARRESRGFDQASITNQLQQRGNQGQLGQQRGNQGNLAQQRGNQGNQFGQQRGNQGQLGQQRGNQGNLAQQRGNQGNQFSQNRSNLERRGQTNGFQGAGNGARTRQASNRGQSSRQAMAQNASARGGGVNRGGGGGGRAAGGRGGGGGGRGGRR